MKFVNVPIGAKILIYKQQVNIKLEDELVFNETLGHLENENPDTEVELVTKCANCKHKLDHEKLYCKIFQITIKALAKDKHETFSCSLFEGKAE